MTDPVTDPVRDVDSLNGRHEGVPDLTAAPAVERLARTASRLVRSVDAPLRRVRIQQGDTVLELEWPDRPEPLPPPAGPTLPDVADAADAADAADRQAACFHVTAPMVGSFYHAPEPGAPPFVKAGDIVEPGQDIGIVEAMKLMNPVQAERSGRVVEILVADGDPVEYGDPLVALEPSPQPQTAAGQRGTG